MAIHSSILVWKIPGAEEPGGLQSMEPMGHKELDTSEHTHIQERIIGGGGHPLFLG